MFAKGLSAFQPVVPLVFLFMTGSVWSQPAQTELEKALQEFKRTFRSETQDDAGALQRAKLRWPELDAEISRETATQEQARQQGGQSLERAIERYVSRVDFRGEALDLYLAGRILALATRLDQARDYFEKAIAKDAFFYWAHHGLGTYFASRQMPEPAARRYERALQLNPNYLPSARGLALCQIRLENLDDAMVTLKAILAQAPNDVESLWGMASLMSHRGDHGEAIKVLEKIDNLDPGRDDVARRLAACYRRAEDVDKAVSIYEGLLKQNPSDWQSNLAMGEIRQRQGRNHEAVAHYEKAKDTLPTQGGVDRTRLEDLIIRLKSGPAQEKINPNAKTPREWCEIMLHSLEPERRRHAVRVLARAPELDQTIATTFLKGLQDQDGEVRTVILKSMMRLWSPEGLRDPQMTRILGIMTKDKDRLVRGMAVVLLANTEHDQVVPLLMERLVDRDSYVFRLVHRALNELSFAYIEVESPDDLDVLAMTRIEGLWRTWYERNRDRYRKYETSPDR